VTAFFRRAFVRGWPSTWSSRSFLTLGVGALLTLVLIRVVIAQSSRRPAPSDFQNAARAFIEGRYDEVASLTQKLNLQDPAVVALQARALIAQGRYSDAESLLSPVAQRAPSSDAALELGLLLGMLGRREAQTVLGRVSGVVTTTNDPYELARAARALRALGRSQDANAAYRDASSALPRDPAVHTAWGELFLEKYNRAEALKSFKSALQLDPSHAPALVGVARALGEENPPQAVAAAHAALKINASSVDALVFLAGAALDAGKRDEAKDLLKKALAVNPSSLDARALVAAIAYVEDRTSDFETEVKQVLAVAPTRGEVYRVTGDLAARNYRFDEAVALTRKAISLEPGNPRAQADLGLHLLRTGDEPGARTTLEASFKTDPFDVVTYNLLQMMDTLDTFVTLKEGDVILRLHKDEAPLLTEYALSLSRRALDTLAQRYKFKPQGPILIEIFPKHDDFAVRNLGLPGLIGALGVCFGRVVTMDSPRARPPGEFQWEATLWHELAHVVTLQMSKQRVPRWLTEGISVYEETLAKREWGRGMDVQYASMMNTGETLKLKDLNSAFTDPKTVSLAYFQASLFVEHLVSRFGDEGLHKLLRAYGEGLEAEAALKSALATDFDQLQTSFDAAMEQRFGAMRAALAAPEKGVELSKMPVPELQAYVATHPKSFPALMALGSALRKAGSLDEAIAAFEKAAALVPLANGPGNPHAQLAQIALERKDQAGAITALRAVMAADFDNIDAPRRLVKLLREARLTSAVELEPVYARIAAIDPFDPEPHIELGRFAMARRDYETASREFRAVLALNPVDAASAHTDLAESYLGSGKRPEARRSILAALEIAPSYERAQDLLLRLSGDGR